MDKPLIIYNTLSRKEEEFHPLSEKDTRLFVCGQTVYDDAHIGHAKVYINFSIVSRWLRHLNYPLRYVQNITDVDDKIIARAKERNMDPIELARHFESRFLEDMDAIHVKEDVDTYIRSHDYIDQIREQIQLLLDKGYAYPLEGDVYYDVSKFPDYTKLSGVKLEELERHRIEPKEGKKNVYDFALWKAAKPGEPSWKITLNYNNKSLSLDGRPGWHIEDTAMTNAVFGPQYDIHGGASDLIFPHHTNEIAQAEAAFGKVPMVMYWMHSGVLRVNGEKMSKSIGNFITIRDMLKKHGAEELRMLIASTHYRKEINYTEKHMEMASKRLRYMYSAMCIFYNAKEDGEHQDGKIKEILDKMETGFTSAMNSDFNTPLALSELSAAIDSLRLIAESGAAVGKASKEESISHIVKLARIFGIFTSEEYKERLTEEESRMLKDRETMRKQGNYASADLIRKELSEKHGITLEDSEYGTLWYRK